ncbi:capsular biosynthesis protein [Streptococcus mitis]|uniref:Capsular biosynthesis protein n=1 Tax=Streptococcus mitis TaxID=28037 RepID=A0A1X1L938_STRMT|nr:sugar transferase [Streptococcus mitis]ORP08217.1 capsular biosynthesis protein [Streptococcus mitis]
MYRRIKRILGLLISIPSLLLIIPICLIACIFIVTESSGNPIYIQERIGLNGRRFSIYKLRSMYQDAEKNGHKWASKNDTRITKVGRFIRKTRIDELPQIINVIKGEMSIIGPRPERPEFINEFLKDIPNFNERLAVRPGITGWAQVNGGYELTPKDKLVYDIFYINHESIKLDFLILLKTIKVMFTGNGSR